MGVALYRRGISVLKKKNQPKLNKEEEYTKNIQYKEEPTNLFTSIIDEQFPHLFFFSFTTAYFIMCTPNYWTMKILSMLFRLRVTYFQFWLQIWIYSTQVCFDT